MISWSTRTIWKITVNNIRKKKNIVTKSSIVPASQRVRFLSEIKCYILASNCVLTISKNRQRPSALVHPCCAPIVLLLYPKTLLHLLISKRPQNLISGKCSPTELRPYRVEIVPHIHTFQSFAKSTDHTTIAILLYMFCSDKTTALVIVVIIYWTLAIYIYSIIYIILNPYAAILVPEAINPGRAISYARKNRTLT